MRLLFICDEREHAHDYGVDYLIQGAYALCGAENVYEWPPKPNLHLSPWEDRDACQIDSDAWLPRKETDFTALGDLAVIGAFDAIILTTAYGLDVGQAWVTAAHAPNTPVIGLQTGDEASNTRSDLERIIGRPLAAYYQREGSLPDGARRFWLSQPASRLRPVEHKPNLRPLFFSGVRHCARADDPRSWVIDSIARAVPSAEMRLTDDQRTDRLLPEVYRDRLWESAVSVVWNTAPNFPVWQCNRFVESLALGCAVVAESPPYNRPDISGVTWITKPEDAGPACARLLNAPDLLAGMQRNSQDDWATRYTSEAILSQMLADVGCGGGARDRQ